LPIPSPPLPSLLPYTTLFRSESLREYHVPEAKQRLVPYGIPLERFSPRQRGKPQPSGKLHILFAGGVNLRKGAQYLLEALRLIEDRKSTRLNSSHGSISYAAL